MRVDKSVIVLFRQMNLFLNRELLDEKLTSSDVLYLALLYEQDGRTQDEMAEAYTVDRAATTRSLQGLEKKGLVRRVHAGRDGGGVHGGSRRDDPQPAGLGEERACAAGSGYVRPTDSAGVSDGESDAVPHGDTADGG